MEPTRIIGLESHPFAFMRIHRHESQIYFMRFEVVLDIPKSREFQAQ
jgi:hypothetical protein